MWVLDILNENKDVDQSLYLKAGEWTIGRKDCSFNFLKDRSVSRTHASIHVGNIQKLSDSSSLPSLSITDSRSRFGTHINNQQLAEGEKLVPLREGDVIRLGANHSQMRVRHLRLIGVVSRVHKSNKKKLQKTAASIGMHLLNHPSKSATHCVMDPGPIAATVKVLWALIHNQHIVSTEWVQNIFSRIQLSDPLPDYKKYLPVDSMNSSIPTDSSIENYFPNPSRTSLFDNSAVIFLSRNSNMQCLIQEMGGIEWYISDSDSDSKHNDEANLLKFLDEWLDKRRIFVVDASTTSENSNAPADVNRNRALEICLKKGCILTNDHDLAGSVIFTKDPWTFVMERAPDSSAVTSNSISNSQSSIKQEPGVVDTSNLRAEEGNRDNEHDKHVTDNQTIDNSSLHFEKKKDTIIEKKNTNVPKASSKEFSNEPTARLTNYNPFKTSFSSSSLSPTPSPIYSTESLVENSVINTLPKAKMENRQDTDLRHPSKSIGAGPENVVKSRIFLSNNTKENKEIDSKECSKKASSTGWLSRLRFSESNLKVETSTSFSSLSRSSIDQGSGKKENSVQSMKGDIRDTYLKSEHAESFQADEFDEDKKELSCSIESMPVVTSSLLVRPINDTKNYKTFKKGNIQEKNPLIDYIPFHRMEAEIVSQSDYQQQLFEEHKRLEEKKRVADELFSMNEGTSRPPKRKQRVLF